MKSRPAGLDFSVEGLLRVSFFTQQEACVFIHEDLISKYREEMLRGEMLAVQINKLISLSLSLSLFCGGGDWVLSQRHFAVSLD